MKKIYNSLFAKAASEIQLKTSAFRINHQSFEDKYVGLNEIKFENIESNFYPYHKEGLYTAKFYKDLINKTLEKKKLEPKSNAESIDQTILKEQISEDYSINIKTSKEVTNFKIIPHSLIDNPAELDAIQKEDEEICIRISEEIISNPYRYHNKRLDTAKLYVDLINKTLEKEKLGLEIKPEYRDQIILKEQMSEDYSINIKTSKEVTNFKIIPHSLIDNPAELDAIKKEDEEICIRIPEEIISNSYRYHNKRLDTAKLYEGSIKKILDKEKFEQEVNLECLDQTILIGEQILEDFSIQ